MGEGARVKPDKDARGRGRCGEPVSDVRPVLARRRPVFDVVDPDDFEPVESAELRRLVEPLADRPHHRTCHLAQVCMAASRPRSFIVNLRGWRRRV